ncbi:MAG: hypothetical protein ABIJ17_02620 [Patescibacteria group bacterium]
MNKSNKFKALKFDKNCNDTQTLSDIINFTLDEYKTILSKKTPIGVDREKLIELSEFITKINKKIKKIEKENTKYFHLEKWGKK